MVVKDEKDAVLLWAKFISLERMEYEAREKALWDYNQGMLEAEQRGEERGKEEGRKEGEKAGRESAAKNMLAMGLSLNVIVQATGLSIAQIESLQ